jgi:ArsR family transcriptional regulator, arsenate/arsenite/antimonite-responsive transcriptional repressor
MPAMSTDFLDEPQVLQALAALAQTQRLRAFRALVVAGPTGLTAGDLALRLQLAPNALSFHLKGLSQAGLIDSESQGRFVLYRARFERMNGLLAYLVEHCCEGQSSGLPSTPPTTGRCTAPPCTR